MLLVADGSYSGGFPESLLQQDKFKDYFKQTVPPGDRNRWDQFLNKLDPHYLRELLTRMEIFRDEIAFVLNNADIPKDEPFDFLKRLSAAIYSMKDVTLGYDETKPLAGFLWTVFTGWDWITGYRKEDIVEKMLNSI